jgi:hypothetical protein
MIDYKDKTCIYKHKTNISFNDLIPMRNKNYSLLQVNNHVLINNRREFLNFSLSIISYDILLVSFVVKVDEMSGILWNQSLCLSSHNNKKEIKISLISPV